MIPVALFSERPQPVTLRDYQTRAVEAIRAALRQGARARGYKSGWAYHVWRERHTGLIQRVAGHG